MTKRQKTEKNRFQQNNFWLKNAEKDVSHFAVWTPRNIRGLVQRLHVIEDLRPKDETALQEGESKETKHVSETKVTEKGGLKFFSLSLN